MKKTKILWIAAVAAAVVLAAMGEHEEEYIKGPGVLFRGDPAKYLTIIRYRVRKTP